MNNKSEQKNKKRTWILLLLLIALLAFIIINDKLSNNSNEDKQSLNAKGTFEYNDVLYKQKGNINTLLLSGSYENKANFIMLLVIDDDNKEILPIQIKRNTICDYTKLDDLGKITEKVNDRIDGSYSYGTDSLSCLANLKDAASDLLCNTRIDYYLAIDLKDIDKIIEELGDVEVVLRNDYYEGDKKYESGEKLTVNKDNISNFVIGTEKEDVDIIEDRQSLFLSSLIGKYQSMEANDAGYTADAFGEISNYCVFNSNDITSLINKFINYKILNRVLYEGTTKDLGFYPNTKSIIDICLKNIYSK